MPHPALVPDAVAVVTGGASGIGLAAARRFAEAGLRVCIADLGPDRLAAAAAQIAASARAGAAAVMAVETDVSRREELDGLAAAVAERWGGADVLMNNAGIGPDSSVFGPPDAWERILGVNLWGVVNGTQAFVPGMIARSRETGRPGLVVNTGSKQGITTPPGNPAYNVSKAGVKVFTEALAHELRQAEGCPDHRPPPRPRLRLHRPDPRRAQREAGRRLDPGGDGRLHARPPRSRRLLHPLPGQRRLPLPRREADRLGGRRSHREPPGPVPVAPGLRREVRGLHEAAVAPGGHPGSAACACCRKLPHRRVALEPDGELVGLARLGEGAAPREELGAGGPVGLVLGEPRVARDRVERGEAGGGAVARRPRASARLIATTGEAERARSAS